MHVDILKIIDADTIAARVGERLESQDETAALDELDKMGDITSVVDSIANQDSEARAEVDEAVSQLIDFVVDQIATRSINAAHIHEN